MSEPRRLRDLDDALGAAFRAADADAPSPDARAALVAALGSGVAAGASTAAVTKAAVAKAAVSKVAGTGAVAGVAVKASLTGTLVSKIVVVTALLAAGGAAATVAARRESPVVPVATTVPVTASSPPVRALPTPDVVRTVEPTMEAPPAAVAATTSVTNVHALADAPRVERRAPEMPAPVATVMASAPASSVGVTSAVHEEVAELDVARRELAAGRPAAAAATLGRYRTRHPSGVMAEEARVLEIEALARSGRTADARALAAAFLAERPQSPLAARIRRVVDAAAPSETPPE